MLHGCTCEQKLDNILPDDTLGPRSDQVRSVLYSYVSGGLTHETSKQHDFSFAESPGACVFFVLNTVLYATTGKTRTSPGTNVAHDFETLLRAHRTTLQQEQAADAERVPSSGPSGGCDG